MQPWHAGRAALYGAVIGVIAAGLKLFSPWAEPHAMTVIGGEFAGAAVAFALLCGLAAALRNFIVRRLIAPNL